MRPQGGENERESIGMLASSLSKGWAVPSYVCKDLRESITKRRRNSNISVKKKVYSDCHLDEVEERVVCIVVRARCILGTEL